MDFELPSILDSLEHSLRSEEDTWNPLLLHVSDLGYTIPVADGGKCARQLWLRLRGAPQRPLHRGELWMFRNASEIHIDASMLLGSGLPHVAPGWRVTKVEHSLRQKAGQDLGLSPDPIEAGQLDVELEGPNGEIVILDWKTRRGGAFRYLEFEGVSQRDQLQVRTYIRKRDALGGIITYLDREGQNFGREFPVERDDAAVEAAAQAASAIATADVAPPILEPYIERKENKGPDSLYLKAPWPCSRCRFLDVSCPGALPESCRESQSRVLANITDQGELKWKPDTPPAAMPLIETLLWRT